MWYNVTVIITLMYRHLICSHNNLLNANLTSNCSSVTFKAKTMIIAKLMIMMMKKIA